MSELTDLGLVVFTAVLAVATTIYAWTTWKLVVANRNLLNLQKSVFEFEQEKFKVERKPQIFASLEPSSLSSLSPHLMNVGKSPARDINVILFTTVASGEPTEIERWTLPSMMPGQKKMLNRTFTTESLSHYVSIEVDVDFKDIEGYPEHQARQRIPVASILDSIGKVYGPTYD
jgi:hypothetical protein